MRFNPFHWVEENPQKTVAAPKGRLRIKCSEEAAFYVSVQGYEVLAGTGKELDVTVNHEMEFRVDAPKKARVFYYNPSLTQYQATGEIFTNPDRGIEESGTMAIIRAELRKMNLQRQADLRAMRNEHRAQVRALRESQGEVVGDDDDTGVSGDEVDTSTENGDDQSSSPIES